MEGVEETFIGQICGHTKRKTQIERSNEQGVDFLKFGNGLNISQGPRCFHLGHVDRPGQVSHGSLAPSGGSGVTCHPALALRRVGKKPCDVICLGDRFDSRDHNPRDTLVGDPPNHRPVNARHAHNNRHVIRSGRHHRRSHIRGGDSAVLQIQYNPLQASKSRHLRSGRRLQAQECAQRTPVR